MQVLTIDNVLDVAMQITAMLQYVQNVQALPSCATCGEASGCEWLPTPGEWTRINCPHWEGPEG